MSEAAPTLEIPKASFRDFWAHYSQWRFGKVLLGTADSWFFLDVAYCGLGLNNSIILSAIGWSLWMSTWSLSKVRPTELKVLGSRPATPLALPTAVTDQAAATAANAAKVAIFAHRVASLHHLTRCTPIGYKVR